MISVAHLGSRPLSRRCLQLMHNHEDVNVAAVVTYPENHDGWWEGSLRELADDLDYPVVETESLYNFDLDYLISTLYYDILEEELLEHPSHGGLNLHQAELPRYRGSNSFSHAIMNAREDNYWKYGTTLHFMNKKVDQGDIVARKFVDVTEDDTAKSLYNKTEDASVELFKDVLPEIVSGEVDEMRTPQSEFDGPTYFYNKDSLKNKKYVDPARLGSEDTQQQVYDTIRAVNFPPFEPAHTELNGETIYLTTDYNYE